MLKLECMAPITPIQGPRQPRRVPPGLGKSRLISGQGPESMDSVRVVEVTIRTYERRDAVGVADVLYRSAREVALSDYTATTGPVVAAVPADTAQRALITSSVHEPPDSERSMELLPFRHDRHRADHGVFAWHAAGGTR